MRNQTGPGPAAGDRTSFGETIGTVATGLHRPGSVLAASSSRTPDIHPGRNRKELR